MEEKQNSQLNLLTQLAPKGNIQENFKQFRLLKHYELKHHQYVQASCSTPKTDPLHKQTLRDKFIQTALKYQGVPYAKKFCKQGSKQWSSHVFLDCCGLIRQVVFDLRKQFGFTLAKWNQAYQYDLLGEDIKAQEAKPGDLVFIQADYIDKRLKPFPHKIVHVEILLGEQKSLGARWRNGTVSIFESYRFQSTLYNNQKLHFKSLDAWLSGHCKSTCQEHKWLDERTEWLSDKFSIFADPEIQPGHQKPQIANLKQQAFVGKGNNDKLVRSLLQKRGFSIMKDSQQFSSDFQLKWTQTCAQIDFFSFKEGRQLANHIPNISILTTKTTLLKMLSENLHLYPFESYFPRSYRLDVLSDAIAFLNDQRKGLWIFKPRNSNQGRGIKIIKNIALFKQQLIQSKILYLGQFATQNMLYFVTNYKDTPLQKIHPETDTIRLQIDSEGIIQHYIQRPLLIKGRKFDCRVYLLVASVKPLLLFYNPGYLRLSLLEYDQQSQDAFCHLTNASVQKKHSSFKEHKESTILTHSQFTLLFPPQLIANSQAAIKLLLTNILQAARHKLIHKQGSFELLGCDVLLDQDFHPYLLQMNTNPALFLDTTSQKQVIPQVLQHSLEIVLSLSRGEEVPAGPMQCIYKDYP